MFFIVLSEMTPNSVPMMLPEPPESIVPPMMEEVNKAAYTCEHSAHQVSEELCFIAFSLR